jgi:hypothetical protein
MAPKDIEMPAAGSYSCLPVGEAQRIKKNLTSRRVTSEIRDREQIGGIVSRIHALGGLTPKSETIERLLVDIGKLPMSRMTRSVWICMAILAPRNRVYCSSIR